jgi:uncharacterized protein (TIGR02246 family)
MTRQATTAVSLVLTFGAFAVSLASQPSGNRAEIDAFYGAWMGSAAQKGPAAYASFYAEDGMMLPPNNRPVAGRSAVEAFQRSSQASALYAVKPTGINVDEVRFLASDWVVYRGTLSGTRTMKADNSSRPFETKYFDVLHRGPDGRWQVAYRMWSDNLE